MSDPVIRVTASDITTGHGCFHPTFPAVGSPNVFINGIAAHREGDALTEHACTVNPPGGSDPPHAGSAGPGSTTVFVNGEGIMRQGDSVAGACGGADQFAATSGVGSPNVNAG